MMSFKILIDFLIDSWFYLTLFLSIFWGLRSLWLFTFPPIPDENIDKAKYTFRTILSYKISTVFMGIYQFLFNFFGSFLGWFCVYILLSKFSIITTFNDINIGWDDLILFILSLLGLTGHLPQVTYGLVESFGQLGKALANKIRS